MSVDAVDAQEPLRRRAELQSSRVERYARMVEVRLVEERVLDLFAEGVIPGTTHTSQGQEAVCVGVAAATRPTDTVACTYRGHGMALALGATSEAQCT
jgi:pyruvate dehydrogenase E1 component alpha subunit